MNKKVVDECGHIVDEESNVIDENGGICFKDDSWYRTGMFELICSFFICGTNLMIDIISPEYPKVSFVK